MKFEYKSSNFISTPKDNDKRIRLYNKTRELKYSIEPLFDYAYIKNNCLYIKIKNSNDIIMTFENKKDSSLALERLLNVKSFFIKKISSSDMGLNTYSTKNLNVNCLETSNNGELACSTPILDITTSMVRVYVNGVDVNVGSPVIDNKIYCFFAPQSGLTYPNSFINAREIGQERKGDYLYWVGSSWTFGGNSGDGAGYELSSDDMVDFVYLTLDKN